MKYLLSVLLMFTLSFYGQNPKTKTILGDEYTANYKKERNEFEICKKKEDVSECYKWIIENEDEFSFMKALDSVTEKAMKTYKFNYFGEEKKLSELSAYDYSNIKITNSPETFNEIEDNMWLEIDKAPTCGFPKFTIKKKDNDNYVITSSTDDSIGNLNKETGDYKKTIDAILIEHLEANKDTLGKTIVASVKTDFKELLKELYNTSIVKTGDYVYLTTKELTDTSFKKNSYNFHYLIKNKNIYVRVCDVKDKDVKDKKECDVYGPFNLSIPENEFIYSIINQHGKFKDGDTDNQEAISKVYYKLVIKKQDAQTSALKKEMNDSITNIFEKIENAKNTFSGQIVINERAKLYDKRKLIKRRAFIKDKYSNQKYRAEIELLIDSVNISFFNNRADNITIVGRLSNDKKNTKVFTNRMYSLPLREFNNRHQTNTLTDKDGNQYTYYYDDILDYLPYKKFNYAVKNAEIKVGNKDSIRVIERKIGDYFTGIFFSDFLGLNSNNNNNLIVAEGRIRIPWHLRNYGVLTLLDNITAYASVNLFSGFENSSRKVELDDMLDTEENTETNSQKFKTNNFNLLVNNNIDAGILVTPVTLEWKGASTFIHLRYGLRFIRTGIEYNVKTQDTILVNNTPTVQETLKERKGFQVFSIGQEAEINFEIRPQSSVGADVTFGLNWFRANGTNKNDLGFFTTNNAPNLKLMANIYALTNSDKNNSGVYFRIGGHYNLGSYKVFPQMMVGYATNLSSFVNKLKKED
ncbi:hypothetical protein [Snuella sedimenti]|uniref:Uncharacterized protein n=1 Tax=Snuella sedimenti TaxID=2798802 RepID=A0A8J7LNA4_9FLAO|nr:hypothetical protein [Snuella sedimenti]MBJ6367633.1 hypothetical protein [Snuella sedimenti]